MYINADASPSQLKAQQKKADKYGFKILAPDAKDAGGIKGIFFAMSQLNSAKEDLSKVVLIVDTVKKFAKMLDKDSIQTFLNLNRQLVAKPGSGAARRHGLERHAETAAELHGAHREEAHPPRERGVEDASPSSSERRKAARGMMSTGDRRWPPPAARESRWRGTPRLEEQAVSRAPRDVERHGLDAGAGVGGERHVGGAAPSSSAMRPRRRPRVPPPHPPRRHPVARSRRRLPARRAGPGPTAGRRRRDSGRPGARAAGRGRGSRGGTVTGRCSRRPSPPPHR